MSEEGRALLKRAVGVARRDGPSAEQSERIARAIGVLPVLAPPSIPPAPVAAVSGGAAAAPWALVVGIGGAMIVIAGGLAAWVAWPTSPAPPSAPPEDAAPIATIDEVPAPPESPAPVRIEEPPAEAPAPPLHRARPRARPRVETVEPPVLETERVAPAVTETTVQSRAREEAALIQRAETALRRDPRLALRLANDHEQRFPSGILGQEREVIRIEALLAMGQRAAAEERARVFDLSHRGSLHSRRIHRLLER